MNLLLVTATMFGLVGLVLVPSRDLELARLGVVMLVSATVFALIGFMVAVVQP